MGPMSIGGGMDGLRITALMPDQQVLQNLTQATDQILQDQTEIATGQALTKPSDNPGAVTQDLIVSRALSQVKSWQNVAQSAWNVAQGADQALSQIASAADTAYTTAESALSPGGGSDIPALVQQLAALQQSIGQLANSQVGDIYVLGGQNGTPPWSAASPTTVTSSPPMMVQLGPDLTVPQNLDGSNIVAPVLAGIQSVMAALSAPPTGQTYSVNVTFTYGTQAYTTTTSYTSTNPPGTITASPPSTAPPGTPTSITATMQIGNTTVDQLAVPVSQFSGGAVSFTAPSWSDMVGASMGMLKTAEANLVAAHAQFGTEMQQIQAAQATLANQNSSLQGTQANLASAPIPNVIADLATQESTYQAILQSAASVIQPTLASYLSQIGG
jgi:flagellar hook-associated protein 3 FlgL